MGINYATWWCKYTCWDYTIHCFTNNGTFSIWAPSLKTYEQIIAMEYNDAYTELSLHPDDYYTQFTSSNNIYYWDWYYYLWNSSSWIIDWEWWWYIQFPLSWDTPYATMRYLNWTWARYARSWGNSTPIK